MSDDELERRLRAARPPTSADDNWAASEAGDDALAAISRAADEGSATRRLATVTRLRGRRGAIGLALTAAAAVALAVAVGMQAGDAGRAPQAGVPSSPGGPALTGPRPAGLALAAYDTCAEALAGLRTQAKAHVDAYRRPARGNKYGLPIAVDDGRPLAGGSAAAPQHSTTNNQERGVDEPDLVQTDGKRIVSITSGILRVTDVAARKVTGRLDISMYAGAQQASMLMSGDRLLLVLADAGIRRGPVTEPPIAIGPPAGSSTTYLLVDISTARPRIVSTLRPRGGNVDARMVGGRARLVVQSPSKIIFPMPAGAPSRQTAATQRKLLGRAPLSTWLPSYTVTTGLVSSTKDVPCRRLEHPATYTGASMLTVYTVDLANGFGDVAPVSLAADGTTVYASTSSLYITNSDGARTQIHRFDISGKARPAYLGSGSIPGAVLDAYSLSDYDGALRAVTTIRSRNGGASTSVYALDADTLKPRGHVDGLGRNEQVYAVRYAGPLAYLVTFQTTDPLYVVDLSNPAKPRATGQLKITGYSDYLHRTGEGRLLGVGAEIGNRGPVGAQVSLFDVSDPARPARLDRILRPKSDTGDIADPHVFQYWPATRTAFVPLRAWSGDGRRQMLVIRVGRDSLHTIGTIDNPAGTASGGDAGIERVLVIGRSIWTLSGAGLRVSAESDLAQQGWVAFE